MRIFVSAGEPSGDLHGGNLVSTLRRLQPDIDCVGFGGELMETAGCRTLYPLCRLAVMGVLRVLPSIPTFMRLLYQADRFFRDERPDAVVLIDYPGFHWWLARRARAHGIPVVYFVPPQLWAWASWRVKKMRQSVDHVLCNLPFEEAWYRDRGVPAHWIGHPYFDELPRQQLDPAFVGEQRACAGTVIGLLPGSRTHEVENNLPTLIQAAARIHAARPDARFLVACYREAHGESVREYLRQNPLSCVQTCVGRTAEIIYLCHSCIAVSGSVGLELLYRGKPSVVVYRTGRTTIGIVRWLMNSPYISLVNLLADRELYPELLSSRCEAEAASKHILGWLNDPIAYQALCAELTDLKQRVAEPGACLRAAEYLLRIIAERRAAAGVAA